MQRASRTFLFCASYGFTALLLLATMASAQYNASVDGTVTDTSGAAVSGATVTVTNQDTGQSQTVTTSLEGFYHVSALPPGRYTVTASFSGFKEETI
ncbi:MAG TPA: carboxypeptidase-like regulatory domain-containing protein [Terriglobia bacterium]|nr:carboxypeptidase-like regulatory domain-containing protein [Terriglobia bacterium]